MPHPPPPQAKYLPLEMSATLEEGAKHEACVAWWTQAHELFIENGAWR